jgi:tRNA pseudouridine38-40 synthase
VGSYRLTVAYDGTPFAGWATQPGQRTVQAELEAALERILGQPARLTVAGRTDAGVHAAGQVASFDLEPPLPDGLAARVNSLLPREVAVIEAIEAPDGFDARRDARSRTYRYRVHASSVRHPLEVERALWWPHPLDPERLDRCAALVVGRHDFTAFTPTETEHVRFERRVMSAEWRPDPAAARLPGRMLELWIEANAFMRHMVRVLVGTMLEVARGRREIDDFQALLRGAPRECAGDTAPAHGLCLESVLY